MLDPVLARDLDRAVGRAVVDDQQLDRVEAVDWRGRSAIVAGSVASSFRQGIWMISFMGGRLRVSAATARGLRSACCVQTSTIG